MPQDRLQNLPLNRQMSLDEWEDYVAEQFGVPRNLVKALTGRESGGNIDAVGPTTRSGAKARGKFQVMPDTAKKYGMNPDDPFDNTYAGIRYLREKFDEAESLKDDEPARWGAALAGYHGGERQIKHINKTGGGIASGDDGAGNRVGTKTTDYVDQIMKRWSELENGAEGQAELPGRTEADVALEQYGQAAPAQPTEVAKQKLATKGPLREPFKSPFELPKAPDRPTTAVSHNGPRMLHHEKFGQVEEVSKKNGKLVVKDQEGNEHTIQNPRKGNRSATFVRPQQQQGQRDFSLPDLPAFDGLKAKIAKDQAFLNTPGKQVSDQKGPIRQQPGNPFIPKPLPTGEGVKPEQLSPEQKIQQEYAGKNPYGQMGMELGAGIKQGAAQAVRGLGNVSALSNPGSAPYVSVPAALGTLDFLTRKGGAAVDLATGNQAPAVRELAPWAMRLQGLMTGNVGAREAANIVEQNFPAGETELGQARDEFAKQRAQKLPFFGTADKLDQESGLAGQAIDKTAAVQGRGRSLRSAILQGTGQMAVQAPLMFAGGTGGALSTAAVVGAQQNWDRPQQAIAETLSETMGVGLERKFGPLIEAGIEGRKWSSPAMKEFVQNSVDVGFGAVSESAEELAVGLATEGDIPVKEMLGAGGAAGFATLGSAFGRRLARRQQVQQQQAEQIAGGPRQEPQRGPQVAPQPGIPPNIRPQGGQKTTITPIAPQRPPSPAAPAAPISPPASPIAPQSPVAPAAPAAQQEAEPIRLSDSLVIKPGQGETPVTVFGGNNQDVDPSTGLVPVEFNDQIFFAAYPTDEITPEEAHDIALQKLTERLDSVTREREKREIIETPVELPTEVPSVIAEIAAQERGEIEGDVAPAAEMEGEATPDGFEYFSDSEGGTETPEWARGDINAMSPEEIGGLYDQLTKAYSKSLNENGESSITSAIGQRLTDVTAAYDDFRKAGKLPPRTARPKDTPKRNRPPVSTKEPTNLLQAHWRSASDERLAKMIADAENILAKAPDHPRKTQIKWELSQAKHVQDKRAGRIAPEPEETTVQQAQPKPVAEAKQIERGEDRYRDFEEQPEGRPVEAPGYGGLTSEDGLQRGRGYKGDFNYKVDRNDPYSALERAKELSDYAFKLDDLGQTEEARRVRQNARRIQETAETFAFDDRMERIAQESEDRRKNPNAEPRLGPLTRGGLRYEARETMRDIKRLKARRNQTPEGKRAGLDKQIETLEKRLSAIYTQAKAGGFFTEQKAAEPQQEQQAPAEAKQEEKVETPEEVKAEPEKKPTLQTSLFGVISALEKGGGEAELASLLPFGQTLIDSGVLEEVPDKPGFVRLRPEGLPQSENPATGLSDAGKGTTESVSAPKAKRQRKAQTPAVQAESQPETVKEPAPEEAAKPETSGNFLVSEDRAEELRRKLKEKLRAAATGQQANAGIDPETISLAVELAVYYLERGVREFGAWAKKVIEDVGEAVRPYLRLIYEGARGYAGFDSEGMTPSSQIGASSEQSTGSVGADSTEVVEGESPTEVQGAAESGGVGDNAAEDGGTGDGVLARPAGAGVRRGSRKKTGDGGVRLPRTGERDQGTREGASDTGSGERTGASESTDEVSTEPAAEGGIQGDAESAGQTEVENPVPVNIPAVDFRITDFDSVYPDGQAGKLEANFEALRLLQKLKLEGRQRATPEEQKVLSQYTGWGQFKPLFDEWGRGREKFASQRAELRELLTEQEYTEASRSTLNAHYTAPEIVQAMWNAVTRLGFKGGRILETSVGSGNFFGLIPEDIKAQSKLTGVERDSSTAGIASYLYPSANIRNQAFEKFAVPDNFYDLAISNVPFGDTKPFEKRYAKHAAVLHDFFFIKALDKVRPGGIVAFITSTGTMDKTSDRVRKVLAEQADLVAAIRLPRDTFRKNAGTSVVTDIVILQKRLKGQPASDVNWMDVGSVSLPRDKYGYNQTVKVNQYFIDNPNQIIGTLDLAGSMYGSDEKSVAAPENFEEVFKAAIDRLPENIYTERTNGAFTPDRIVDAESAAGREGAHEVRNGKLYRVEDGVLVERPFKTDEVKIAEKMLAIRDAMTEVLQAQVKKLDASQIQDKRTKLYDLWKAFTKAHGALHSRKNKALLKGDPDLPRILATERYDKATDKSTPADINMSIPAERVPESPQDAIFASIAKFNRLDMDWMVEQLKTSQDELEKAFRESGIAFDDPALGSWVSSAEYLSGNVKRKLVEATEAAKADEQYKPNVKALEKVQPPDVAFTDIGVRLGSAWVPPSDHQKFLTELLGVNQQAIRVEYNEAVALWSIDWADSNYGRMAKNSASSAQWAVANKDIIDMAMSAVSGSPLVIRVPNPRGEGPSVVDQQLTERAQAKVADLQENFLEWIWKDAERRERLHRAYNDTHNNLRENPYDPQHYLDPTDGQYRLPGMSTGLALDKHQASFVYRAVTLGRGFAAHEVGTGKTRTAISTAMEWKRLGIAKKPLIATKKKILPGLAAESREMYPAAKLLDTVESFDAENRKRTTAQIAANDWDAVLITHEQLQRLQVLPETKQEFYRYKMQQIEDAIIAAKAESGEVDDDNPYKKKKASRGRGIVGELEKAKEGLQAKLDEALQEARQDDAVYFEELGVDGLIIDEAHAFKNLPVYSTRSKIKGLPTGHSQRSLDMEMRTWLMYRMNGDRANIVFATGTPLSNSLAEAWVMQQFIQKPELIERGLDKFDAWASTFAQEQTTVEYQMDGKYKSVTRFNKFINIPELQQLVRQHFDVVFADDVPRIVRPEKLQKIIPVDMTEDQIDYLYDIQDRAQALASRQVDPKIDNYLKLNTHARWMALDPRLVMDVFEDVGETKLDLAATEVKRILDANPGTTQFIALDIGMSVNDRGYSAYVDLIDKLVAQGIPRDRIARFDTASDVKAQEYIEKLQTGDMWIALGSSDKVGIGLNIQQKLKALHHVDISYTPDKKTQRDGRIWRQGNTNKDVEIIFYVTTGSFDTAMWQMVEAKQKFFDDFMRGKSVEREIIDETVGDDDDGEIGPGLIKAIASGDPEFVKRVELDDRIRQLERGAVNHRKEQADAQILIPAIERQIEKSKAQSATYQEDADFLAAQSEEEKKGKFTIGGKVYEHANEAGQQMFTMLPQITWEQPFKLGEYRGFDILATRDRMGETYWLQREGRPSEARYFWQLNAESVQGTMQSLRLAIEKPATWIKREGEILKGLENDLEKAKAKVNEPYKRAGELEEKKREREEVLQRMQRREVTRIREDVEADKALLGSAGPFPITALVRDTDISEGGNVILKRSARRTRTLDRKEGEAALEQALRFPAGRRLGRYRGFDIIQSGYDGIALRRPRSAAGFAYTQQAAIDARVSRELGEDATGAERMKLEATLKAAPILSRLDLIIDEMPGIMDQRLATASAQESSLISQEGPKPETPPDTSGIRFSLSPRRWWDAVRDYFAEPETPQRGGLATLPDWGKKAITSTPRTGREARKILLGMKFEYRERSNNRPGVLYVNAEAMGMILGLSEDETRNQEVGGLSIPNGIAIAIAGNAREAAEVMDSVDTEKKFIALADVVRRAYTQALAKGQQSITVVNLSGMSPAAIKEAVRHEATHTWQEFMFRSSGFRGRGDGLIKDSFLTEHPLYKPINKALRKRGYRLDTQGTAAEAMAYIFSGNGAALGLNAEQSATFAHDILMEVARDYGLRAVEQLELMVPGHQISKETIEDAREEGRRANTGDSTAGFGQAAGVSRASLRGREEGLAGGLQEGGTETGKESAEGASGEEGQIRFAKGQAPKPIGTVDRLGRKASSLMTGANLIQIPFAAKNVLSNAAFGVGRNIERVVQAGTDKLISKATDRRYYTTPMSPKEQARHGIAAFKDVVSDVRHNRHPKGTLLTAYEMGERQFTGGPGKYVEDALTLANFAPDRAFFMAAYEESMNNQRRAQLASPVHTRRTIAQMDAQARAEAQRAIFADKNPISRFTGELKRFINVVSTGKLSPNFGLADFIGLHYPKVPGGLAMRAIEYSPLSFFQAFTELAKSIPQVDPSDPKPFKERFRQKEFVEAFSRAFVGTSFGTGLGYVLSLLGILVMPDDDKDRWGLEEASGLGTYQINVSAIKRWASGGFLKALKGDFSAGKLQQGDHMSDYDWLQPYALMLSVGAALQDAPKHGKGRAKGSLEAAVKSLDGALSTVTDQTVIKNIRRIFDALSEGSSRPLQSMIAAGPASLVPAVVRQARYVTDNIKRDTRPEHAKDIMEEAVNRIKANIPGLSNKLPARPDVFGRTQYKPERDSTASKIATSVETMTSPIRVTKYKGDSLVDELRRLDLSPADPNRRKGELTSMLRVREKEVGQRFHAYGRNLVDSNVYRNADDTGRAQMLTTLREKVLRGAQPNALDPGRINADAQAALERERHKK